MSTKEEETTVPATKIEEKVEVKDVKMESSEEKKEETPTEEKKEEDAELEHDSPEDKRKRVDGVVMNTFDSTLNCLVTQSSCVLASLQGEGLNLLVASRASVGVKKGRYYFETEILQTSSRSEIRIGFSTSKCSLYLGDEKSICFSSTGSVITSGKSIQSKGQRFNKGDIVGVLLNRGDDGLTKNTVSVFVNGARSSEPLPLSEDEIETAMYPHVSFTNAIVAVNITKSIWKALSFKVRMLGDASAKDVELTPFSEVADPEVVVPMAFDTKTCVEEFQNENPSYMEVSRASIALWQEKSGVPKGPLKDDTVQCIQKLMGVRKHNYILALGNSLFAKERELACSRIPVSMKKVALVTDTSVVTLPKPMPNYKDVTLPTTEEGFSTVTFTESEGKAQTDLTEWQKACKLGTKVEDLKAGTYYKEQFESWTKVKKATRQALAKKIQEEGKKEAEEKKAAEKKEDTKEDQPSSVDVSAFAEEDWKLADLRVELHLLCHAFEADVEDKDRKNFLADHVPFYYKLYNGKVFPLQYFGCKNIAECVGVIDETVDISDGMLVSKLASSASFDVILEHVEKARHGRQDRIDAGDECAVLKFKVQNFGGGKGFQQSKFPLKKGQPQQGNYQSPNPVHHQQKGKGQARPVHVPSTQNGAGYQMRPLMEKRPLPSSQFQSKQKRGRYA